MTNPVANPTTPTATADFPIACEIHRWINLPQPRTERPHLDRWYAQGVYD